MRTKYELQKKERSSMLANISVEQHAFSLQQQKELMPPPPPVNVNSPNAPSCSAGNIREAIDSDSKSYFTSPAPSSVTAMKRRRVAEDEPSPSGVPTPIEEASGCTNDDEEEEDTSESVKKRRKKGWFNLF